MRDFSSGEGFIEVTENLSDMIKFVANEPSVGLFYVQQHAHNATSDLVSLKNSVVEKSHETSLHTEDLKDSILMVKSMKECGFPIADEMIRSIKKSLSVMSSKQPKRGVISPSVRSDRGFLGRTSSWSPSTWGRTPSYTRQDSGKNGSGSYFSSVFNSAKQRASDLTWPTQVDSPETSQSKDEDSVDQNPAALSGFSTPDNLSLSSKNRAEIAEGSQLNETLSDERPLISLDDNYEEFKADREAKLEEWLGGGGEDVSGGQDVAPPVSIR